MNSVGRIDGAWVGGDGGNIANIILDTPNNNIIFFSVSNDGNTRVIDIKGKCAYFSGQNLSSFTLTNWNNYGFNTNQPGGFQSATWRFLYVPVDSGIFMINNSNNTTIKVQAIAKHDTNTGRIWFIAVNGSTIQHVLFNISANYTEVSYTCIGTSLKFALGGGNQASQGWTGPLMAPNGQPLYSLAPNSYTTFYNNVINTITLAVTPPPRLN
jgi:hypothetical protein